MYRQTASDLAAVLEDKSSAQLAVYLNQLLGRSHNLIYMGRRPPAGGIARGVVAFYRDAWPRIFRETLPRTLFAVAIFAFAMAAGWAVTIHDPGFAHRLLSPQMMDSIERREMWTHSVLTVQPLAASAITTNNLTVAFTTYALGITVIGTIWMMLLNGLLIGVVGAATWHAGMAMSLWSFVAPHGVLELPAIFIAGGAGFRNRPRRFISGLPAAAGVAGARRGPGVKAVARLHTAVIGCGHGRRVLFAVGGACGDEVHAGVSVGLCFAGVVVRRGENGSQVVCCGRLARCAR